MKIKAAAGTLITHLEAEHADLRARCLALEGAIETIKNLGLQPKKPGPKTAKAAKAAKAAKDGRKKSTYWTPKRRREIAKRVSDHWRKLSKSERAEKLEALRQARAKRKFVKSA